MALDLAPSQRPHGAQRMLTATTLSLEALVVFFAALVSHQLNADDRGAVWTFGLITAVLLIACAGMLKRGTWPYLLGAVLQIPMILMGIWVSAMWVVGILFAAFYVFGVVKGHALDAEKDAVDARYWAEHPEQADPRS